MTQQKKGKILLAVTGFNPQRWYDLLSEEREVVLEPEGPADPSIDYAVVWKQRPGMLARLPNLKAIFSIGAGVDHILTDTQLPDLPIVRVVADNLSQHMIEYVTWRVLDHHRQGLLYRTQQSRKTWYEPPQPVASAVTVGIMGLGELGTAAARALSRIGFTVTGWSRTEKTVDGIVTHHGDTGLDRFLQTVDILVVLLPLTPQTRGIIDYSCSPAASRQRARRRLSRQRRSRPASEGSGHRPRA